MAITIKEIHVKTTVEKRPDEIHFSEETLAALKRSIIKEIANVKYTASKQIRKDR